jgi:hypothetical protein
MAHEEWELDAQGVVKVDAWASPLLVEDQLVHS